MGRSWLHRYRETRVDFVAREEVMAQQVVTPRQLHRMHRSRAEARRMIEAEVHQRLMGALG